MSQNAVWVWSIIALLGLGTFLIRLSFMGFLGGRELPPWLLRHLRYTPVAVLPGLVAPLVLSSGAEASGSDGLRITVAAVALGAGYLLRNATWGVVAAAATFWIGAWVF